MNIEETKKTKWYESFLNERTLLYEGLIISVDREHMERLLRNANIPYTFDPPFRFYIDKKLSDEEAIKLKQVLNVAGWYVAWPKNSSKPGYDEDGWFKSGLYASIGWNDIKLKIEPKYDIELMASDLPDKLYHVSPKRSRDSILSDGLTVGDRSKKANHPKRLYFATSLDATNAIYAQMKEDALKDKLPDFVVRGFDVWITNPKLMANRR